MSNINLIGVEFSREHFYPTETLYIKCTFQALCDQPADRFARLYADFDFGHMNIAAADTSNYSRVIADMYPQPMCYKKGEIWSSSIRWNIPTEQYPGALQISVGMVDDNMEYIPFCADGKSYNRFYVGDINVAFPGAGKVWVDAHSEPAVYVYDKAAIMPETHIYDKGAIEPDVFDAILCVRDVKKDTEIKQYIELVPGEKFENEKVAFSFKKENDLYYIDDVSENDGYELLNIKLPLMYTVKEGKMVSIFGEGRLIDSKNSYPWGYEQKYYVRNVGIITDGDKSILLEVPYIDDRIHYSVCERNGQKLCALGVTFTYRMRCYGEMESIKVMNKPAACVCFVNGSWQNCIPALRQNMEKKSNAYDRCLFYYYTICSGPKQKVRTFAEALEQIKKVYYMTGGMKQYMIMCGWQHEGHDTGYPDVFTLVKGAGTLEELKACMAEAKKYNACMTFHDNYDDMYQDNGYFEADCAAINPKGKYLNSWIWVGGVSTIMSLPKYCKSGKMQERVRKTVEMLGVDESYHIDVLSCEARRYDYDPAVKMAGQEVVEYKKAVVEEFKKYGVTVTSEGISHAFAQTMGFSWRLTESKLKLFTDEIYVPFTAMIYHGILPYAGEGVFGILNGSSMHITGVAEDARKELIFLKNIPIGLLCNQTIDDYSVDAGVHQVIYSDGKLLYNEYTDESTVVSDGVIVTEGGNTFAPGFREKEYVGYTKNGDFVWTIEGIHIKTVCELEETGERTPLSYSYDGKVLTIDAAKDTAFVVEVE